jgi:hypothetical protein
MKGRNIVLVAIVIVAILSFLYIVRCSRETFDPANAVMTGRRLIKDQVVLRTIKTPNGYIFAAQDGPYVRISVTTSDGNVITNRYYYGSIESLDSQIGPEPYDGIYGLMEAFKNDYGVSSPSKESALPIPDLLPLPAESTPPPITRPKLTKEDVESQKIVLTHNCLDCLYDEDGKMRCNCQFKQRKTASAGANENTSVLFLDSM